MDTDTEKVIHAKYPTLARPCVHLLHSVPQSLGLGLAILARQRELGTTGLRPKSWPSVLEVAEG